MAINKHLTLSDRIIIEQNLNKAYSFKAIGKELNRDCTTIAKEVKKNLYSKKSGGYGRIFNNCVHRFECSISYLCENSACKKNYCKFCVKCISLCKLYEEEKCKKLLTFPYVCNGCTDLKKCTLEKFLYSAALAQKRYEKLRSESRIGIDIDEEEAMRLDSVVSPLIMKGQSIHHICSNNSDILMRSEKTIYNYVDAGLFAAKNIDLPRKVRYRPREKSTSLFKVDKACRIGRTYQDFISYISENPDTPIVEMDTVEGIKGGKVLLTIHFVIPQFMIAFLRDSNTSRSVTDIFDELYRKLEHDMFTKLFQILLVDNGSEFSNPTAIEFNSLGERRTRIFYCDPSAPYQKGAAENNHTLIRRIVPKGHSLNNFDQDDIIKMMNNINSYTRKKLNGQSPYQALKFLHGEELLNRLGATFIPPNEVILKPSLLKKTIG